MNRMKNDEFWFWFLNVENNLNVKNWTMIELTVVKIYCIFEWKNIKIFSIITTSQMFD